jgi:formate hydrogenlyase transcriptional activator
LLPLTSAHARLGAIGFGSTSTNAYNPSDMEFLEQIARQVAVAVDNTLRHRDALALHEQLQHERDRLQLLLRLNNNLVSNLDLRDLLRAVWNF